MEKGFTNKVSTIRHNAVFSATAFGETRVDIIGCGATGSRIAMGLAKLGIQNLHIWDFDTVESQNVSNQIFYLDEDIGKKKVVALAKHIRKATGLEVTIHDEKVDGSQELGDVVFLLTDTMASRKEIWEKSIRDSNVRIMIETRMNPFSGRIYMIDPNHYNESKFWEETLKKDGEIPPSPCGGKTSVGPTAERISGDAQIQFLNWINYKNSLQNPKLEQVQHPTREMVINLRPIPSVLTDDDLGNVF
ncbi:MAG: ThiF family adenylyltransferase [Candidatus Peribacteria bacterium]|jgi:molybdopterin/thiamine biosynthesis adenylyltransferase|nr:ThiF family adenylyltransferase [Candidatus Peribacteria bacterium]